VKTKTRHGCCSQKTTSSSEWISQNICDCGYRVAEAINAHEAIVILGRNHPAMSAVISNVELAGNGFGLAKWLNENRPELPLVLTGTTRRAVEATSRLCKAGPLPTG
jgi:hypothetical protein